MVQGFTIEVLFVFMTAFVITLIAIPSIIILANKKNLFDEPDDRKLHTRMIPTLGGLAIFAGLIFSFTFWEAKFTTGTSNYIQAAIIVLFFIGIKDDLAPLSAIKKLIGQLIAAFIIILWGDIRISSFYGVFGIWELPFWFSVVFSLFTIIVIINAFNLIDGVDGLAAGLGMIAATVFGYFFFVYEAYSYSILAFALAGSLLAFLRFNFAPAQIFMGDTGSLIIGLVFSILAIAFIELGRGQGHDLREVYPNPSLAIAFLLVPLFDTLRVFVLRTLKGKSPLSADRNHIHHRLLEMGLKHKHVSLVLYLVSVGIILFALNYSDLSTPLLLFLLFSIALLLSQIPTLIKYLNENKPIL